MPASLLWPWPVCRRPVRVHGVALRPWLRAHALPGRPGRVLIPRPLQCGHWRVQLLLRLARPELLDGTLPRRLLPPRLLPGAALRVRAWVHGRGVRSAHQRRRQARRQPERQPRRRPQRVLRAGSLSDVDARTTSRSCERCGERCDERRLARSQLAAPLPPRLLRAWHLHVQRHRRRRVRVRARVVRHRLCRLQVRARGRLQRPRLLRLRCVPMRAVLGRTALRRARRQPQRLCESRQHRWQLPSRPSTALAAAAAAAMAATLAARAALAAARATSRPGRGFRERLEVVEPVELGNGLGSGQRRRWQSEQQPRRSRRSRHRGRCGSAQDDAQS